MSTWDLLGSAWDWEPSVVAGSAALAAGYLALTRGQVSRKTAAFLGGVVLLLLSLVSPVDALGDQYLFSAHVLQHFLLALIIPALLVLGTPRGLMEKALVNPPARRLEAALVKPGVAWMLGIGTMIGWHIPALFNAALASSGLHIFQHLSFLVTGTIFWWPVLQPAEERRLALLPAIVYLFSACTACSLLGAWLTFTPPGAYPAYLDPADPAGILRLVRGGWGLDPKSDQQLGGMLMWVPGCFVYLTVILSATAHWYNAPERAEEA